MQRNLLPGPSITITKAEARRFMLSHHALYPPRDLMGKEGILDFIHHAGCIQFDPINIVGRNPDLVLQSRVKDYRPVLLDELLYKDRQLLDGWDKMAAIYRMDDWPYFSRHRHHQRQTPNPRVPPQAAIDEVLKSLRQSGPLSSLEVDDSKKVDWYWGPTKVGRAALEYLYSMGYLGIHHRVNNRRSFDLVERLVPSDLVEAHDPFATDKEYQDWHILRRIGGLGLADPNVSEYWYGILGVKPKERKETFQRLAERDKVIPLEIDGVSGKIYFIRQEDYPTLLSVTHDPQPEARAAIIAPLDNFIWNRVLIGHLFDFEYVWEVYKPKSQRKYGYYVLPVVYNDRFIARFEPLFDKKTRLFTLNNWWWEGEFNNDTPMVLALEACFKDFLTYLDASAFELGNLIKDDESLHWFTNLAMSGYRTCSE